MYCQYMAYFYMQYIFKIQGETPAKKNSRITLPNGRTIPSKKYREWHEIAAVQILAQKGSQRLSEALQRVLRLEVMFYHGDMRKRDCDNGLSSICDLLVDCGVLADDNWKIVRDVIVSNAYDKNNARAIVVIKDIDN